MLIQGKENVREEIITFTQPIYPLVSALQAWDVVFTPSCLFVSSRLLASVLQNWAQDEKCLPGLKGKSKSFVCIPDPHSFSGFKGYMPVIESFWESLLIVCDVASSHLLCSSVVVSSQSVFLLLLWSLFFTHLPLPYSLSLFSTSSVYCFHLLFCFLFLFSFFFSLFFFFFFPGSHFLEHVGDKQRKRVKGEGFGREM